MGIRLPVRLLGKQIFRQSLFSSSKDSTPLDVPKGCLAVYIAETQRRFVVPVSYLNQPMFEKLLRRAEEEYEFNHPMGGLTIPCKEETFLSIISQLSKS